MAVFVTIYATSSNTRLAAGHTLVHRSEHAHGHSAGEVSHPFATMVLVASTTTFWSAVRFPPGRRFAYGGLTRGPSETQARRVRPTR